MWVRRGARLKWMSMEESHTQTLELDSHASMRRQSSTAHRPWGRLMSLNSAYPHVDLFKDQVWLGRHADCDIHLVDGCISGKHCCIARRPDDPLPRASLEDNRCGADYEGAQFTFPALMARSLTESASRRTSPCGSAIAMRSPLS